jgi:hypothetical protein
MLVPVPPACCVSREVDRHRIYLPAPIAGLSQERCTVMVDELPVSLSVAASVGGHKPAALLPGHAATYADAILDRIIHKLTASISPATASDAPTPTSHPRTDCPHRQMQKIASQRGTRPRATSCRNTGDIVSETRATSSESAGKTVPRTRLRAVRPVADSPTTAARSGRPAGFPRRISRRAAPAGTPLHACGPRMRISPPLRRR